ncbi:MAG: alpha/beta hydrolase fold domain-containing protein [Bryobacteraceae bacterium]|nr:alpha/beta hydrolase fold domain-containing protein [Bryobacteraceae bacterium]
MKMPLAAAIFLAIFPLLGAPLRQAHVYKKTPQGELRIHVFYPIGWSAADSRPGIVFFFGGGFKNGSPEQFFSKAQYLASRGMVAASAEYRIESKHKTTPSEAIEDCASAIHWMREKAGELGVDPKKVLAGGGSAGATCATMAVPQAKPEALVLYNPGYSGGRDGSGATMPPSVFFYGDADPLAAGGVKLFERMREAKIPAQLHWAKGQPHGFFNDRGKGEWHASTTYATDQFLAGLKYLNGKPTIALPEGSPGALYPAVPPVVENDPRPVAGVKISRNLVYAKTPEKELKLDLYLPETNPASALPLIVWVHGGAWQNGSKSNPPAAPMAAKGYAVASVAYRFSSEAIFPAQLHDVKAAIRWLRNHAGEHGIDGARIGVWGSSAGGHLVALLGTAGDVPELEGTVGESGSSRVQAVVDYYGPAELRRMSMFPSTIDHDSPGAPESRLIGGPVQQNAAKADAAGAVKWASAGDAPFLIVHGDSDLSVPLDQSERLHQALKAAKVESELVVIPGAAHGGPQFMSAEMGAKVEAFFARHLRK